MAIAQKKAWAARRAKAEALKAGVPLNGTHRGAESEIPIVVHASRPRQLMKATVNALAVEGAKQRLAQLDREREVLMMFIQGTGAK